MMHNVKEENIESVKRRDINLHIRFLEDSVKSCNAVSTMKYIRYIDQFSNMDSLTRYGVEPLKAIDIHRQADEKVRELINKFEEKCKYKSK